MRVLIVSFFYEPEPNDIKIHSLGAELVRRGHEVTTVTTFPNYPYGEIYDGYTQKWRQWETKDGVKVLRLPIYADHTRSGIKRILSYISFMLSVMIFAPFLTAKADVMWVYHPPLTTGMAGWWLSLLKRLPFVYDIQDMWPETLAATGMFSNPHGLRVVGAVAKWIYRRAKFVNVDTRGMQRNLIEKGVPEHKITVYQTWTDEAIYRPLERDPEVGKHYGLEGRFNVMFGGNMGLVQSLHTGIEAATKLQDLPDFQLVLIGDGLVLPDLQAMVEQRGLTNVRFIERQPASNMPALYAWADALWLPLKDDPLFEMTIPAKTQSYLACARPIICSVPGDGAEVIRASGAGVVCPPEDALALEKAIRRLYTMPRDEREKMGESGRIAYQTHFQRKLIIDQYEQLFQSIITK